MSSKVSSQCLQLRSLFYLFNFIGGLVNSLVGSLAEGRAEEGTHTKTGQEELHLD